MIYTDKDGQPAGFILDMATKSIEKAGFGWSAVSLPTKRLAKSVATGEVQLWVGLPTLPHFEGNTYVGQAVVEKLILRAYTIGNNPPILEAQDLHGKTILILRGYSYGGWIKYIKDPDNNIEHLEIDSHENAFKRLEKLSTRIPNTYLLDYKNPSVSVLSKLDIPDIQYNQISSLDMHFVVTKNMDNAETVLERIETAFLELSAAGAF